MGMCPELITEMEKSTISSMGAKAIPRLGILWDLDLRADGVHPLALEDLQRDREVLRDVLVLGLLLLFPAQRASARSGLRRDPLGARGLRDSPAEPCGGLDPNSNA